MDIKWTSYDKMIAEGLAYGIKVEKLDGFDAVRVEWQGEVVAVTTINELEKFMIGACMGMEYVAKQVIAERGLP